MHSKIKGPILHVNYSFILNGIKNKGTICKLLYLQKYMSRQQGGLLDMLFNDNQQVQQKAGQRGQQKAGQQKAGQQKAVQQKAGQQKAGQRVQQKAGQPGQQRAGQRGQQRAGQQRAGQRGQRAGTQQRGGAGYDAQRAVASANLAKGEAGRSAWVEEVKAVQDANPGMSYGEALHYASQHRKEDDPNYLTVKERVVASYKPRKASDVNCAPGKACPGAYNSPATSTFRPGRRNKSRMTQQSAVDALREHYRSIGQAKGGKNGMKSATKAMRQDISKQRKGAPLVPCPTKLNSLGRRVVDKNADGYAQCRDNWLFRNDPTKYDMEGVDHGESKKSSAYGKRRLNSARK